jgi:acyl-CoA thioesterase FadM
MKTINAKFYSDAKYGEKIQVCTKPEDDKNIFFHTMKTNKDEKLLVAAHTSWAKM